MEPERDDDREEFISLDDSAEPESEPVVQYDAESGNFAHDLLETEEGKDVLKEVCDTVLERLEESLESSKEYRERQAANMKIFMGVLERKTFPFEGSASANVPIMLENISRLQSRLVGEIFGDWAMPVGVMPVGEDDGDLADLVTMHTNWQFREQIPGFRRQMDRAALSFLFGDLVVHSYRDESKGQNCHEVLLSDDFIVPYAHTTTEPDFSDLPYYHHVRRMYPHQLEAMIGKWANVEEILDSAPDDYDDDPDAPVRRAVGEAEGQEQPESDNAPYKVIQFEGWLQLPNQDRHRWCQVIVHEAQRLILSLSIHEEPDWRDQQRHDRELAELEEYAAQLSMWQEATAVAEAAALSAVETIQAPEEEEGDQLEAAFSLESTQPIPRPPAPQWMSDPDNVFEQPAPVKTRQICMYAHGVCLENLAGAIGMGMAQIEADYTRAANTALSQFTDAATLANCWSLVTTDKVQFAEPFTMRPGKVNKVKRISGQDLKSNIMELKAAPANPQLMELVNKFYEYGQSAIQAPNVLSGEPGKSGETYRGISTRIEQATKQLSTLAGRFAIPLKQIYVNNARLNSLFMDDIEVVQLLNHMTRKMETVQVNRSMYERSFRIEFKSDMKFTSEAQKIAEADEVLQMSQAFPALQTNLAFQFEATKRVLEARQLYDMVQLLGQRPPPPQVFGEQLGATGQQPPQGGPPAVSPGPPK
jgi:hypothetical protein